MEPTLHSFIYTYSIPYIYRVYIRSPVLKPHWPLPVNAERCARAAAIQIQSTKEKDNNTKKTRERKREREKVFVFLLSVLFRRTKIIKLALCKTRQKLFKLDNCAAGTVVVVRHCCSSTERKNLWHHDDNNNDDDITNNYIVTSPTPTWSAKRQLRDSVYS